MAWRLKSLAAGDRFWQVESQHDRQTMKITTDQLAPPANPAPHGREASAKIILLLFTFLAAGFIVGSFWRQPRNLSGGTPPPHTVTLSESTAAVLSHLREPLQIRYYALFSEDQPAEAWLQLTTNTDQLVAEFERLANGKLIVTRIRNWTPENTKNAAADGVTAANLTQGDPVYFGFTLTQANRKEALPQVSPQWAAALEFDLARAIARVSHPPEAPAINRSPKETAFQNEAEAAVKRVLPDSAAITLEEGIQKINAASLQEFRQIVEEMNAAIAQAEPLIKTADSESAKESALQKLRELRAGYEAKAREVAPRAQAQIEAWTRLKGK